MNKGITILIAIIFSILMAVHMLLSVVMFVGLNPDIYRKSQIADNVSEYAEINQETLDRVTAGLIDYMGDSRDDLVILSDDGINELFNVKEKTHMVDVKALFVLGKDINTAIFIILVLIMIFYLAYDRNGMKKHFMKYCAVTLSIILGVWIIIALLAIIDFSSFWTTFHKIFFTNDLWILNPRTDLLIRMMPQRFFIRIVIHILMRFLAAYIAVIGICMAGHRLLNKKKKEILPK